MTRPGIMSERLISLFVLGLLFFSPPLLGIFDLPETALGIPVLYLFLFVAWLCLIVLTALTIESARRGEGAPPDQVELSGEDFEKAQES